MARVLYRLGGWSYDRRRIVLAAWVAVLVGLAALSSALGGQLSNSYTIPGSESQNAQDLLKREFPGTGGAAARIVFVAPPGHTLSDPQYRPVIRPTFSAVQHVPQTVGGPKAFNASFKISKNRRIGYADIAFAVPFIDLTKSTKAALGRVAVPGQRAGLGVYFSGVQPGTSASGDNGTLIAVILALIVLAIVFGRALPAILPLITAGVGVVAGLQAINAAAGVTTVLSTATTLATMLGLAVGIDYALFILTRHRQHLADGLEPREAAARAVATAGGSVTFAGTTVVIALLGLAVVGIPLLTVMGIGAAVTVVFAVLVALTLVPALLGFSGARLGRGKNIDPQQAMGRRWAQFVVRHRVWMGLGVIVVTLAIAIPALHMRLGLQDDGTHPPNTTERKAYDYLTEGFGPGFNGPLQVVVTGDLRSTNAQRFLRQVDTAAKRVPSVAAISPPIVSPNGQVAIVNVTPSSSPQSEATKSLVKFIRQQTAPFHKVGLNIYVTGPTALGIDFADKLAAALPVFLPVIVGLCLVLLLLMFRSLLVPVKAVVGFLLTIAASFGLTVWIFQDGNLASALGLPATAPILSFLPIIVIAILFGLAMDYELFLVSRMRESFMRTKRATPALIDGFAASGRVVTAAAIIMFSVFASFGTSDDLGTKSFGVVLAFGVLVDAFLVRMTLVPAVLALVGKRAWHLPAWLDRRVPDLDVEGERLIEELERKAEKEHAPGNVPS